MKKLIFLIINIFLFNIAYAESMKMIGKPGKIENVTRIINIKLYDNYFEPKNIQVKKGETILFNIENLGQLVHEYSIATKKMHIKHQPEMLELFNKNILTATKIDKEKIKFVHSHKNSVLLEPQEEKKIIWKFDTTINLQAACNVPGHYEAGMAGDINLN